MKKRKKLSINITQWKDGVLDIIDVECNSMDEAKTFIKGLKGNKKVKVYDENRRLQHTENVDNEDKPDSTNQGHHDHHHRHHHHHGHHDDDDSYC